MTQPSPAADVCALCGQRGRQVMSAGYKVQLRDSAGHLWWIDAGAGAAAIGGRLGRPVPNLMKKRP